MTGQTRAAERLENIRGVTPLLEALRTIALANSQAARRQWRIARAYSAELGTLLPLVKPEARSDRLQFRRRKRPAGQVTNTRQMLVIIGSQRGLCGGFNNAPMTHAQAWLTRHNVVRIHLLGSRLKRSFDQTGMTYDRAFSLPFSSLPTPTLAQELLTGWLAQYEDEAFDELHLIFNRDYGQAGYKSVSRQLLPFRADFSDETSAPFGWPPPIVETDPEELFGRLLQQLAGGALFTTLIESSLAEQSARYRLMESAVQNADRLVAELTQDVQSARQQAMTQEMQTMAAATQLAGESHLRQGSKAYQQG